MTIGVFFGSRSPEHDISIVTGQLIISGLKGLGYPVMPIYISKKGEWLIGDNLGTIKKFTAGDFDTEKFKKYHLDLEKSQGKLVFRKKGLTGKEIVIDLAFPAFHGANGEDGTFQGLLEMFNVPYVGCDVTSSAITMDKILTKQICEQQNIPTAKFVYFAIKEWNKSRIQLLENIREQLGYPVFVKPARLGSSIGIIKAKIDRELEEAIEVALHYGERVLIEAAVENLMDLTVSVIGQDEPIPSLIQESVFGDELFSYDDKYLNDGGTQLGKAMGNLVIPARLDEKVSAEIRNMAIKVFKVLGCRGIARVDFLYNKIAKKFLITEVNTLPGTLYHHLWAKSGVELPELLKRLIQFAQEAHADKNRYQTTFDSDLLKMAGSIKLKTKKDGG